MYIHALSYMLMSSGGALLHIYHILIIRYNYTFTVQVHKLDI